MYHLINRGKLCCNASVSYYDINHDLINDLLVDDIEKVAQEFGYPKFLLYCEFWITFDLARSFKGKETLTFLTLNRVYEKMVTEEVPEEILEKFMRICPFSWQYLLFTGHYSFKKANKISIDVAALAELMEQHLKQAFWKS